MSCQEAIILLGDYLEATLAAADLAELETHLHECDECVAYLNTYRRTPELARAVGRVEMTAEMRQRLRGFLTSRLSEP